MPGGSRKGPPRLLRRASDGRRGRAPPRLAGTCGQAGESGAARGTGRRWSPTSGAARRGTAPGAGKEREEGREGAGRWESWGKKSSSSSSSKVGRGSKETAAAPHAHSRPPSGRAGPRARSLVHAPTVPAPPPLAHARPDLLPAHRPPPPPSRSATELLERGAARCDATVNGRVPTNEPRGRPAPSRPASAADPPPPPLAKGANPDLALTSAFFLQRKSEDCAAVVLTIAAPPHRKNTRILPGGTQEQSSRVQPGSTAKPLLSSSGWFSVVGSWLLWDFRRGIASQAIAAAAGVAHCRTSSNSSVVLSIHFERRVLKSFYLLH